MNRTKKNYRSPQIIHHAFVIIIFFAATFSSAQTPPQFWQQCGGITDSVSVYDFVFQKGMAYAGASNGLYASTDQGINFSRVGTSTIPLRSLIFDTSGALLAATGSAILRSTDLGISWTNVFAVPESTVAQGIPGALYAFGAINAISTDGGNSWNYGDTRDSKVLGDSANGLYTVSNNAVVLSTDGGEVWNIVNDPTEGGYMQVVINDLELDIHRHIYMLATDRDIGKQLIIYSDDRGQTWHSIQCNSGTIARIAINDRGIIYASESNYQYPNTVDVSADTGATWTYCSGLFNKKLTALAFSPDGHLFTGTDPGGLWRSVDVVTDVRTNPITPENFIFSVAPNPVRDGASIDFQTPTTAQTRVTLVDQLGRTVENIFSGEISSGAHHIAFQRATLSSGMYWCRMATPAGVHVVPMVIE